MYDVDARDRVVPVSGVPQSDAGAPLPLVLADEYQVLLGYLLAVRDPDWDGTYVQVVGPDSDEPGAIIEFHGVRSFYFGAPNDEAFEGHPLADRGLTPYSVAKIEDSSWIRRLERMNSVHPQHRPKGFWELSHFVFAFHDSTFECVANSFTPHTVPGPMSAIAAEMHRRLFGS